MKVQVRASAPERTPGSRRPQPLLPTCAVPYRQCLQRATSGRGHSFSLMVQELLLGPSEPTPLLLLGDGLLCRKFNKVS